MERLRNILIEQLYKCQLIYGGQYGKSREEMLTIASAWAETLYDCWDFPGDAEVLLDAFLEHKQSRDRFPCPCVIRERLYYAKRKHLSRKVLPEKSRPADPELVEKICRAILEHRPIKDF